MSAAIVIVAAMLVTAALLAVVTVIRNTYICSPNEVLIFSGRRWAAPAGGAPIGYRLVRGGRAMRVPVIETVDRMALTNMTIDLTVRNAFSRGGIPLNVQAIANVKIPGEEPLIYNTIQRFLGRTREDIIAVAKETLEGNLRGVIAQLSPEEINQDKTRFQQILIDEGEKDLQRLGLVLDNLKLQNVSDEVGYLDSIGRIRAAEVRRGARIGEVRAQADATVNEARNWRETEIAKIEADIQVAIKANEQRIANARTQREATIAEARGQVQAQVAEAKAQLAAWAARTEQMRRRLEADVIAPAEARRAQLEAAAKGQASQVLAQGRASADALARLAEAYRQAGPRARDALVLQKLVPVFEQLAGTLANFKVDRITVLGGSSGGGANGANGAHANGGGASLGAQLVAANEQLRAATGVDLVAAARARVNPPAE